MKAVAFKELRRPLEVVSQPDPSPGSGEVVLSVSRCGICGSDLHMAEDHAYGAKSGDVFGHEFAGEVVAVGREVERLAVGDFVSVVPYRSCGKCASCLAGDPAWCTTMKLQGGGYAEYACIHERQCVSLPKTASLADGAIVEPLAVALHGVRIAGIKAGDRVLVLGAGPIGLSVAFWARRAGAAEVVVQDVSGDQHDRALAMGATQFIWDRDEPVAASQRALGGLADVVAIKGRLVLLGLCRTTDAIIPFSIMRKEIQVLSSVFFHRKEYEAALDALILGAAEPRFLITDTVSLDSAPAAFEALKRRTGQCKVLIDPGRA
jgi:(R,R)-butanediol dehydrogenase/meso-butanediol dehydrogenase/diacetyl reductase